MNFPVHKRLEYLPVIICHATVTVDVNVELKGSTKISHQLVQGASHQILSDNQINMVPGHLHGNKKHSLGNLPGKELVLFDLYYLI